MKRKVILTGAATLVMVLGVVFFIPSVTKAIGRFFEYMPQTSETSLPEEKASPSSQISLVLNKYVQTDEQLILMAAFQSNNADFRLSFVEQQDVHLIGMNGNEIAINEDYSVSDPGIERTNTLLPLSYTTAGRYTPGTATLMIDRLWAEYTSEESFVFDLGSDPQPGQTWTLNKELSLDGYSVTILDATVADDGMGLSFNFETPDNIDNLTLMDLEHPVLGGGGGSENTGFSYRGELPSGVLTITITGYSISIVGPWQTQVELPAFADGVLPTAIPQACLTKVTWDNALLSSAREIPVLLGGKLILADIPAPDYIYHILSVDLSGASSIDLGLGDDGSLSPDSQNLVYATDKGLKLLSLTTGAVTPIPGSSRRDRGPIWSPDGAKIAFTRGPASGLIGAQGPYELMLMDSDGSNQTVLLSDTKANYAQAWMPFSKVVLYTVKGPDGASLKYINSETGKITPLTDLNYQNAGVSVSPNGRQIAYEALLPGNKYVVYISSLDGSNAKLIANADAMVATNAQWSPDGEWLVVSVQDTMLSEYSATIALVNPDTCQVIPMTNLKGYVTSWR